MTPARSHRRPVPYVMHIESFAHETIAFLPSNDAVFSFHRDSSRLDLTAVMPGASVVVVEKVEAVWSLSPTVIKAMLGPPAALRGAVLRASDHPALRLLAHDADTTAALDLMHDLRASLTVTPDEREFETLWWQYRREGQSLPSTDRRLQRLFVRFAGLTFSKIATIDRFAATVLADREARGHNSLGLYADSSHYARTSRKLTGFSPAHWRNVSFSFYRGLSAPTYRGHDSARMAP